MHILEKTTIVEEIIKKSRFIGIATHCDSEQEAMQLLHHQYQQHPQANHTVFAYRILTDKGIVCRFHDAGEPSGTAGKPVFQHLEGKDLINTLIIVIRYFGGVKLGAGGLTRAYGNAAKQAINEAKLIDFIEYEAVDLELDYKHMQSLQYHLPKLNGEITEQNFAETIKVKIKIPANKKDTLLDLFS